MGGRGLSELHKLLMLNCGFTAKDISDLRHDEVDWDKGTITRKRSKTASLDDVPEVTYKLWGRAFSLLKEHRSTDADVVLLTKSGQRWVSVSLEGGKYHLTDNVGSNFREAKKRAGVKKEVRELRTTAASKLGEHASYKYYAQYYLGHSPKTVAEKHYVKPNDTEFAEGLTWLEKALGL